MNKASLSLLGKLEFLFNFLVFKKRETAFSYIYGRILVAFISTGVTFKICINDKQCAVAFQPNKARGPRDLKMLCAEEEQSRMCWVTAIRLLKVISLQLGVSVKCWEYHQGWKTAVVQNAEIHRACGYVRKKKNHHPPMCVFYFYLKDKHLWSRIT